MVTPRILMDSTLKISARGAGGEKKVLDLGVTDTIISKDFFLLSAKLFLDAHSSIELSSKVVVESLLDGIMR